MRLDRKGYLTAEAVCPPEGLFHEYCSQALTGLVCHVDMVRTRPARETAVGVLS